MATATPTRPTFPNYTQMRQWVPQPVWYAARVLTIGIGFGIILTLFIRPQVGLLLFWGLLVLLLPITFFAAPGLWRNICPMAALNQTPRLFNFSRVLTMPAWLKNYAYVIGITMFFVIVPTTILKVAGVDLMSIGEFEAKQPDDIVIALEQTDSPRYRKLVIREGKIVGAILFGYPREAPLVNEAIKAGVNVTRLLDSLRAGDWEVLAK